MSWATISLGRQLLVVSSNLPEGHWFGPNLPSAWSCSRWGLPGRSGQTDRRCALTAPFHLLPRRPKPHLRANRSAPLGRAYFLLHLPDPYGRWALPTIVSCGARTFLADEPTEGRQHQRDRLVRFSTEIVATTTQRCFVRFVRSQQLTNCTRALRKLELEYGYHQRLTAWVVEMSVSAFPLLIVLFQWKIVT